MHQRQPRFDPRLVDGLVVAAVALPGIVGLAVLLLAEGPQVVPRLPPHAAAVGLMGIQAAALWRRRRYPLHVLAITLAALVAAQALGDTNAAAFFGPHAAAYAVAVYGDRRGAVIGFVALGLATALDVAIVTFAPGARDLSNAVLWSPTGLVVVAAWGVGRYVRVRRDYLDTLVDSAHHLELEQEERTRRAVLEELRRIARELHDEVAHNLGVAALQTGAARTWLDRDVERAGSAMASAEEAVRAALTTMPVILEALRTDDAAADFAPQPGLREVEQLIAGVAEAGLPVDLHIEGEPRSLAPSVDLTAYRIVQEALTNALKHAGRAHVTVRLRYGTDRLDIDVTDDGPGASAPIAAGAGLGLVGMQERVDVLGGTLHAGPRDGGGFAVRATLPVRVLTDGSSRTGDIASVAGSTDR